MNRSHFNAAQYHQHFRHPRAEHPVVGVDRERTPFKKPGRMVCWLIVLVFGVPGLYDLVTGAIERSWGLALYGLGWAIIATVFILYALDSARLQTRRARVVRLVLGYVGLAVAICGFVMKYRGIS